MQPIPPEREWDALIHGRIAHIVASLSTDPDWKNVQELIHSRLSHLDPSLTPSTTSHPPPTSSPPLSRFIDHTLLKPEATNDEILTLCREAHTHSFYSVCVNPHHVPAALSALSDLSGAASASAVKVVAVCGFPLGQSTTVTKAYEAAQLRELGAHEVDMVINLSLLLAASYSALFADVRAVVDAAAPCPVKVILETAALSAAHVVDACIVSALAGAKLVKTSTGFHAKGGATVEAVRLMRRVVGDALEVKASGGVRDSKTARAMLDAGAMRLGTSASIAIVQGDSNGAKSSPTPTSY